MAGGIVLFGAGPAGKKIGWLLRSILRVGDTREVTRCVVGVSGRVKEPVGFGGHVSGHVVRVIQVGGAAAVGDCGSSADSPPHRVVIVINKRASPGAEIAICLSGSHSPNSVLARSATTRPGVV